MSPKSEFQNLSFHILRSKSFHCWYFTILFALCLSLSQFFFISAVLCHWSKAMSLVGILP